MNRTQAADPDKRRRDLAAIHAAATKAGMDTADKSPESTYRTMLRVQAGVTSAADLDEQGRRKVLAYLLRQTNPQGGKPARGSWQTAKIERLWAELGTLGALYDPSPAGLAAFVAKRYSVDSHLWLTAAQANQVIEALKAMQRRYTAKA